MKARTEWYPGSVNPVRPGVYQVLVHDDVIYRYWNGAKWFFGGYTARRAAECYSRDPTPVPGSHYPWRGVPL